jgi:hypothetical protein
MKVQEFITMSSLLALLFSVTLFIFAPLGGIGFTVGLFLFIYFFATLLIKIMWSIAGKVDDTLSGVIHDDQ